MDTVNKTVEQIVFEGVDKLTAISKSSQSAVKDLRGAINSVQNVLAGIGVTVGAGALLNLYHDSLKATAALNDMAQQTGASVEGSRRSRTSPASAATTSMASSARWAA
jgi:hypothetical protein